jgi:hypothetical protein
MSPDPAFPWMTTTEGEAIFAISAVVKAAFGALLGAGRLGVPLGTLVVF